MEFDTQGTVLRVNTHLTDKAITQGTVLCIIEIISHFL